MLGLGVEGTRSACGLKGSCPDHPVQTAYRQAEAADVQASFKPFPGAKRSKIEDHIRISSFAMLQLPTA